MTCSDLIVRYLEFLDVEYVFSVPGSPISPLYDALIRRKDKGGPRGILVRHENGGAFMADGYARATGKLGVCCGTTGPGATNMITGVASANADHVPLLAITAQTSIPDFGWGGFQESSADVTDTVNMFDQCTRYNSLVSHPGQLEKKVASALQTAMQEPRGAVHLSIPVDILRSPWEGSIKYPGLASLLKKNSNGFNSADLERLLDEVSSALTGNRRIIILVGHDCGGASEQIIELAELIQAPVLTSQRGKRWVNPYHPLARGVFGFAGHASSRNALMDESVELVLAIGTGLWEWPTSAWDPILLNDKLIHIHNTPAYFHRSPYARLHICGAIPGLLKALCSGIAERMEERTGSTIKERDRYGQSGYVPENIEVRIPENIWQGRDNQPVKPQQLLKEITSRFPAKTNFLIDNSNSVPWSIHYFFHPRPENYHLSIGFASMGWAIGAAVGMALGSPGVPAVCITGDGCFLMSGQEITVAVQEKLPVTFIVLNDRSYGMIKFAHHLTGTETVDYSIPPVDFCEMARSVGAEGCTVRDIGELRQIDFHALSNRKGPTLLDVYIDQEEVPPLGMF
ncbi:MAG: thiamine pyrophosphate-binding protein [Deltaproteobacteria bacterium]|nr:thiamine pyrophosphate-binding protein [Deltaproteobacteria bacterium]